LNLFNCDPIFCFCTARRGKLSIPGNGKLAALLAKKCQN
jgi:hypothetical protein